MFLLLIRVRSSQETTAREGGEVVWSAHRANTVHLERRTRRLKVGAQLQTEVKRCFPSKLMCENKGRKQKRKKGKKKGTNKKWRDERTNDLLTHLLCRGSKVWSVLTLTWRTDLRSTSPTTFQVTHWTADACGVWVVCCFFSFFFSLRRMLESCSVTPSRVFFMSYIVPWSS